MAFYALLLAAGVALCSASNNTNQHHHHHHHLAAKIPTVAAIDPCLLDPCRSLCFETFPELVPYRTGILCDIQYKYWSASSNLTEIHHTTETALVFLLAPEKESLIGLLAMIRSFDRFYPFEVDVVLLMETVSERVEVLFQRITRRRIVFVDISEEFTPRSPYKDITWKSCAFDIRVGYRYMIRFMSGPLYWLPQLDNYTYALRMDDDSLFTAPIHTQLTLELEKMNSAYAYAVDSTERPDCYYGFEAFIQNWIKEDKDGKKPLPILPTNKKFMNDQYHMHNFLFNCNFEIVRLDYFRHPHYRKYWKHLDDSGLFFSTRLGDHEVKTAYLDLYEAPDKIICFANLPYFHSNPSNPSKCASHQMVTVVL